MSYIRNGSNPEHLYIFGSRAGVEIYPGHTHLAWGKVIPQETWDKLCSDFVKFEHDEEYGVAIDGYYVKSDWVDDEDGHNYKTILGYKDEWSVVMWDVTWWYIVRGYE